MKLHELYAHDIDEGRLATFATGLTAAIAIAGAGAQSMTLAKDPQGQKSVMTQYSAIASERQRKLAEIVKKRIASLESELRASSSAADRETIEDLLAVERKKLKKLT